MPELPEVETVCVMRHALVGETLARASVSRGAQSSRGHAPRAIERALVGREVAAVGRRGKYFWLALRGSGPALVGHLGMSGWIARSARRARACRATGRRRSRTRRGLRASASCASRRRAGASSSTPTRAGSGASGGGGAGGDPAHRRARAYAFDALPTANELAALFARRKARAIKAVLLDQAVLAGIGNWIADEVLYQARIAPARVAASLTRAEVSALRRAIGAVLALAVRVSADHRRFPAGWLFEHRRGRRQCGSPRIGGNAIVREWSAAARRRAPAVQR